MPPNVDIIGTMNDVDRNVESFDFAMRRRFRFIDVTPGESGGRMKNEGVLTEEAFRHMQELNTAIRGTDEDGRSLLHDPHLGTEYEIGPSYFIFRDENSNQLRADELPACDADDEDGRGRAVFDDL